MTAPQVEEDLRQHHGRNSSRSTLHDLAELHDLKHKEGAAKKLRRELDRASPGNKRTASLEKLIKARTYFKNHWHQMTYPEARERSLPIGSGVTKAACKSLVKDEPLWLSHRSQPLSSTLIRQHTPKGWTISYKRKALMDIPKPT